MSRVCLRSTTIGTGRTAVNVPYRMCVQVDVWNLHRDETIWGADAGQFKPERWLNSNNALKKHSAAFMGYGTGSRSCPLQKDCMIIMKAQIATLVHSFVIATCDRSEVMQFGGQMLISDSNSCWHQTTGISNEFVCDVAQI